MSNIVDTVGDEAKLVYRTALEFLEEWKFETNLQFPKLLEDVAKKLNIIEESEKKELDAQIRYFVRRNPNYTPKRGAHGGIALASAEAQREAAKNARLAAKAAAAADVASKLTVTTTVVEPVPDEVVFDEVLSDEGSVSC